MLPLALAAGGAALGAYNGYQDNKREQKDRQIAATTARYSPWTGMQAQPVQRSKGMLGGAAQGGLSGAMLGQNINSMNAQDNYLKSQTPADAAAATPGVSPAPAPSPAGSAGALGGQSQMSRQSQMSSAGAVGGPQQSMMQPQQRGGYAANSWQNLAMQQRRP